MKICEPRSDDDFKKYYELRWKILREPWNQPRGSERDEMDDIAMHIMVCIGDEVIGVSRLHFNSDEEAQIRYMAVDERYRRKGIGTMMLKELEGRAREKGARYVVLNARENAVDFYRKNGYTVVEKTYTLFNSINHFKMRKFLDGKER
ncbi:MAG: GNAT family N-acetyltransferase [Deltaproteobacteria bacterium]|nr:GNAT family N-acetyltransferase [Deltaproteobacteria bacterium]